MRDDFDTWWVLSSTREKIEVLMQVTVAAAMVAAYLTQSIRNLRRPAAPLV